MDKEEVLRHLRLVYKISHGASELLPPLQAKPFPRSVPTISIFFALEK